MNKTLRKSVETIEREEPVLQDISQELVKELDSFQNKIDEAKEHVRGQFTEIREILDRKEREILERIEETQSDEEELNQLISDTGSVLDECQATLTTGKTLLSKWKSTNFKASVADKAIYVVNKAKEIQRIKRTYDEVHKHKAVAVFRDFEDQAKKITQLINSVPAVVVKRIPTIGPMRLGAKEVGPFFVTLEWDRVDGKYDVSLQKEGEVGNPKSSFKCSGNKITINTLEPNTTYKFRVKEKRGGAAGEWSDALVVKTAASTIENMISLLMNHCHDARICIRTLKQLEALEREGTYHISSFHPKRDFI